MPDPFSFSENADHLDFSSKDYFKPYSAFLNYKTYFLVSYFNFVIVFDMTNEKFN